MDNDGYFASFVEETSVTVSRALSSIAKVDSSSARAPEPVLAGVPRLATPTTTSSRPSHSKPDGTPHQGVDHLTYELRRVRKGYDARVEAIQRDAARAASDVARLQQRVIEDRAAGQAIQERVAAAETAKAAAEEKLRELERESSQRGVMESRWRQEVLVSLEELRSVVALKDAHIAQLQADLAASNATADALRSELAMERSMGAKETQHHETAQNVSECDSAAVLLCRTSCCVAVVTVALIASRS